MPHSKNAEPSANYKQGEGSHRAAIAEHHRAERERLNQAINELYEVRARALSTLRSAAPAALSQRARYVSVKMPVLRTATNNMDAN